MEALAVLAALTMVMEEAKLEAELARFPQRQVTDSWLEFSWNHLHWIKVYAFETHGASRLDYLEWYNDCHERRMPWKFLQAAQNRLASISSRRNSLYRLSEALGSVGYISGHMPTPVPLSRFYNGGPPAWLIIPSIEKPD